MNKFLQKAFDDIKSGGKRGNLQVWHDKESAFIYGKFPRPTSYNIAKKLIDGGLVFETERVRESQFYQIKQYAIPHWIQSLKNSGVTLAEVADELNYRDNAVEENRHNDNLYKYTTSELMLIEDYWEEMEKNNDN